MSRPREELHVEVVGPAEGVPVVLIHGFPFDRRMWAPQVEALSNHYRVVTYDVRGLGRSPVGDGQHTMELFVDDLISVLDREGVERVVGCGLSMGGYILLRALEREADRFRGAVLCDTRSGTDDDQGRLGRARAIRSLKDQGHEPFLEGFLPEVLAPATLEEKPEVVSRVETMVRENPIRGMCGALLAMAARTDTTSALAEIRVPVLVLAGEDDALTGPGVAREISEAIPRSELRILPGAGHVSNLENPEEFNRALLEFLGRI